MATAFTKLGVFAALSVILAGNGSASPAQSFVLHVSVKEELSRFPIADAHVVVRGDTRQQDGYTDDRGIVDFGDLRPDVYHVIVTSPDYAFSTIPTIAVGVRGDETITVLGKRTTLPTIIRESTRRSARSNPHTVDGNSPATIIAGAVAPSILTIPQIGLSPDGNITLNGHGYQTIAGTVNGAPIFPTGTGLGALSQLRADIFQSATLGGPLAAAPSGTIGFETYDPTIDWIGSAYAGASSYDGKNSQIRESGSVGSLGISIAHAENATGSPLNGDTFADSSGLSYPHDTMRTSSGDTITLREGFTPDHVAFLDLGRFATTVPYTCDLQQGSVPCGYGPNNFIDDETSYAQLRDFFTLERGSVAVHAFFSKTSTAFNLQNLHADGQSVGYYSTSATTRHGILAQLAYVLGNAQTPTTLTFQSLSDRSNFAGTADAQFPAPLTNVTVTKAKIEQPIFSNRRFGLSSGLALEQVGPASGASYDLDMRYALRNHDTLSATFSSGALGAPQAGYFGVVPPNMLQFDCAGERALGTGPTFPSSGSRTSHLGLSWAHTSSRFDASVTAYSDREAAAEELAVVPAQSLSPDLFSNRYFADAATSASAACGKPTTISVASTYFQIAAPALVTDDGIDLTASYVLGQRATVSAGYAMGETRAFGNSPLFVRASTLVPDEQLPLTAIRHWSAGAAIRLSKSATALLAMNYFGPNNYWRSSPLLALDAGLRVKMPRGFLVLSGENVGNTASPNQTTFARFPYFEHAYGPRTYSLRLQLPVGRENIDAAPIVSTPAAYTLIYPVPFSPRGSDGWLEVDKASPVCGPEKMQIASRYLAEIETFKDAIQAALISGRDPSTLVPPNTAPFSLSYVRAKNGYAIRIFPTPYRQRETAPLLQCAVIHSGTIGDAELLGIYVPGYRDRDAFPGSLYYAPQVGIYMPPDVEDETNGAPPSGGHLPPLPPSDPFVIDLATCPTTDRNAVTSALHTIQGFVGSYVSGKALQASGNLRITPHPSSTGTWFEISDADMDFVLAIAECVNAPVIDRAEIAKHHLSGGGFPSLNYAPAVGFYRFSPGE